MALVTCDGCQTAHDPKATPTPFHIIVEQGVQVRYCDDCATIWSEFDAAQNAMAARYQRQLDAWVAETRVRLPLKVTPLDFPALATTPAGVLRLG